MKLIRISDGVEEEVAIPDPIVLTKAVGNAIKRWEAPATDSDALASWAYRNGYEVPEETSTKETYYRRHRRTRHWRAWMVTRERKRKERKKKHKKMHEAELREKFVQVHAYQRDVKGKKVDVQAYTRDVGVNAIEVQKNKIFFGEPVKSEKISKSKTGKIGEALTLHQKGGMPVNQFLGLKENNLPFDVINVKKGKLYEVKAGLIRVGYDAKSKYDGMKWRLTKGEPSKGEKKLLKKMTPKVKLIYNKNKEGRILARKLTLQKEIEKRTGKKFTVKTIAYIINPTTKQADMYEFNGLHPVLRWRNPETAKGYKRSVRWK